MKTQTNPKLSDKLNDLVQQAVDKAIENHRQKGESIAIADAEGKVKIIPAEEIPQLQQVKLGNSGVADSRYETNDNSVRSCKL